MMKTINKNAKIETLNRKNKKVTSHQKYQQSAITDLAGTVLVS